MVCIVPSFLYVIFTLYTVPSEIESPQSSLNSLLPEVTSLEIPSTSTYVLSPSGVYCILKSLKTVILLEYRFNP